MKLTAKELFVDLFAGGGGASTGIENAIKPSGRHIDVAVNHDEAAIILHQANHPKTEHYLQSVFDVEPRKLVDNGNGEFSPIALCWGSPDCTHFSKASANRTRKSCEIRGLAWSLVRFACLPKALRPTVLMIENVQEFTTWGPLDEQGMPIKEEAGKTFRSFVKSLEALGYKVEWRNLVASDYGAATSRERFFLIARCDGKEIIWPSPTHAPANSLAVKNGLLKPYRSAGEIIDWSLICKAVEGREKPLAENTLKRIANGIKKFVINDKVFFVPGTNRTKGAFIITYYTETREGEARGLTLYQPLATITAKGNRFGLIQYSLRRTNINPADIHTASLPNSYGLKVIDEVVYSIESPELRMLTPKELFLAQGFPKDYIIEGNLTMRQLASRGISEKVLVREKVEEIKRKRLAKGKSIVEHDSYLQMDLFSSLGFEASEDLNVKPMHSYSKKQQVARCGNSVCPQVAEALVRANLPEYCQVPADVKENVAYAV